MSGSVGYHPKDWERIERLGLNPTVVSPDGYAARTLVGMKLAHATLSATKETVPTIATITGLHYLAFEGVHPWAGSFRQEGHEVRAGKLVCSLAKDVVSDLTQLRREMTDNPLTGSRRYKAEVLAFYHASFLAIHPFADGNGRVGRIILDVQTKRLLGHGLSTQIGREEYIQALSAAQGEGDLRGLAKLISQNDLRLSRKVAVGTEHKERRDFEDSLLVSRPKIAPEGDGLVRSRK